MKTVRRFLVAVLVTLPLTACVVGTPTAGAELPPRPHLPVNRALCEECGDPDAPAPSGEPGDAEVDVIIRAVADVLLGDDG
jgi:hypothetical protein